MSENLPQVQLENSSLKQAPLPRQKYSIINELSLGLLNLTFEKIERFLFRATLLVVFILELVRYLWFLLSHW